MMKIKAKYVLFINGHYLVRSSDDLSVVLLMLEYRVRRLAKAVGEILFQAFVECFRVPEIFWHSFAWGGRKVKVKCKVKRKVMKPNWFVEPWEGPVYQGCGTCPAVEQVAPLDLIIGVGFGSAMLTRDSDIIYAERSNMASDEYWTVAEAEKLAAVDPDHDWRIILAAPLRDREYQRHGPGRWVLIYSGPGFA